MIAGDAQGSRSAGDAQGSRSAGDAQGSSPVDAEFKGAWQRWYVLAVLSIVYAANIGDRFVVSTVLEPLKLELKLSNAETAAISGVALAIFYITLGIPIAAFADRANRRNILAAALATWSVMTVLCGRAQTVGQFVLARFGVGIGEAGGTPPSTSMLADHFPPRQRAMAFTIFGLGAPLGAWLGSAVAGRIAQQFGWRAAFLILGIPGVIMALFVFLTIKEPVRGRFDRPSHTPHSVGFVSAVRMLWLRRSARHLIAGGTIATLWGWGLLWWTPTYLMRMHGMSVAEAGATLGPMHLVAGSLATIATSFAVNPAVARDSRRVVWLIAVVIALATIPSIMVFQTQSKREAIGLLWVVVPTIYFFIGPTLGLLQNVVRPENRAQAVAILLLSANIGNLIVAPQLIGLASDWLAPFAGDDGRSLRWALLMLAPTGFWAATHYWLSARTLRLDENDVSRLRAADYKEA